MDAENAVAHRVMNTPLGVISSMILGAETPLVLIPLNFLAIVGLLSILLICYWCYGDRGELTVAPDSHTLTEQSSTAPSRPAAPF